MLESPIVGLCRDCLATVSETVGNARRCPLCSGPRLVWHKELSSLSIAHVDCDAFYAAIEKRDDPSLLNRAVIVGGGRRGVVATACYNARTFGIRSAMPMFKALKACPDAVVIRPDMAKYAAVSRQIRAMMLTLTPAVEPISIDEAFLDLTGTERLHGAPPAAVLVRFQQRVATELGISVSIGLSHNKFLAKIASDLDKPRGFAVIGRTETRDFLADKSVSLIWGVGQAMQERLLRDGIATIGGLQHMDERKLAKRYGSIGLRLARLARGEDDRVISPHREAKSLSAETTFATDIHAIEELLPHLRRLAEKVSARLKAQHLAGQVVVLKLKSADFKLRTRNAKLDCPTNLADRIHAVAGDLLRREADGTAFRLVGVGVSDLGEPDAGITGDLLDSSAAKRAKAEAAMDDIRARYGVDGLALGLTFEAKPKSQNNQRDGHSSAPSASMLWSEPDKA